MRKRVLVIAALLVVIMGVSVSDSIVNSTWSITNMTASTQTDFIFPVKVSTQGLLDSSIIGADGLKWEVVDGSDNEVPFMPSPSETTIEGCGLDGADDTTDCTDAGTADVELLTATGANLVVDTDFAFGAHHQFTRLEIAMSTAGQFNTDPDITWEYCTTVSTACTVWSPLTGVSDDTEGFTKTGTRVVSWDVVPDFVESDEAGALPLAFWVRARVTTQVDNADYITRPVADIVNYSLGYANVFACDPCDDSDVSFAGESLASNESTQYNAHLGMTTGRTNHRFVTTDAGMTHAGIAASITGDYTIEIEASFKPSQTGSVRYIFQEGAASDYIRWASGTDGELEVLMNHATDSCAITAASGIADDRIHTIRLSFDEGTDCRLYVDGAQVGIDASVASTDLPLIGTWAWGEDASTNYIERASFDDGNLTIVTPDIEFELTDLSTYTPVFFDNSGSLGATHDATPTFPLWTANLVGTATAFLPATVAGAGADVIQPDLIGDLAPIDNFVATPAAITLPGNEAVTALFSIDNADIPVMAFWIILGTVLLILALIVTFRFTQNIVLTVVVVGAGMALLVSLTIFSVWQVFVFAVIAAAVILVGKGIVSSV